MRSDRVPSGHSFVLVLHAIHGSHWVRVASKVHAAGLARHGWIVTQSKA